jgi:acylphosphatase
MNQPENIRLHVVIEGEVQGVGFRYFVLQLADLLGLTGWVRNLYDGRVEVMSEGTREILEKFQKQLESGPRGAYVSHFEVNWEQASGEYKEFQVRRTGEI